MASMNTVVGDEQLPRWTNMGHWLRAVTEYHTGCDDDFRAVAKKLAKCAKKTTGRKCLIGPRKVAEHTGIAVKACADTERALLAARFATLYRQVGGGWVRAGRRGPGTYMLVLHDQPPAARKPAPAGQSGLLGADEAMVGMARNYQRSLAGRLAAQWQRRNPVPATHIPVDSAMVGWWACAVCGHSYQASVITRVRAGNAAPTPPTPNTAHPHPHAQRHAGPGQRHQRGILVNPRHGYGMRRPLRGHGSTELDGVACVASTP